MKKHRCKVCKGEYVKQTSLQQWCSPSCGFKLSQIKLQKKQNDKHKELKKKVRDNDRSHWTKKAQSEFNKYIRARDENLPCVSCGRFHSGQYHAGHYRTVGASPELRFDELNCHKQCSPCNNHLSGNIVNYRINLSAKIGADKLEWLEGNHEPKRYTIDDLKEIAKTYRAKTKELEQCK